MAVSRVDTKGLNKEILDTVLAAPTKPLPAYTGISVSSAYVIARIEDAVPGTTSDPKLEGLPAQLTQIWGNAANKAVLQALRKQVKVKKLPTAEKARPGDTES